MNVPCILPAKKAPPAKADCVSASGKRADFLAFIELHCLHAGLAVGCGIGLGTAGSDLPELLLMRRSSE